MPRSSTRRDGTRTRLRWRCRRSRRDYPGRFAIMSAHDIIFSSNVRMAAPGHEDAFPRPRANGRCRVGQGTIAGTRGNGEDAPTADVPALARERGDSTKLAYQDRAT